MEGTHLSSEREDMGYARLWNDCSTVATHEENKGVLAYNMGDMRCKTIWTR